MLIHVTSHPNSDTPDSLLKSMKKERGLYFTAMHRIWQASRENERIIKNLTDPDGTHYRGTLRNGKPQGQGTLTFANGDFYEGDFVNNKLTGKGTYSWATGDTYEGDFDNGQPTGIGTFIWPNRNIYKGDFVNGQRTGIGTFTWANGNIYKGDFDNDQRTGIGTFTWANGDTYEGDFDNGQRTGTGPFIWPNGDIYKGDFDNDQRTGIGSFIWPNGDIYKGDFVNGQRTGIGSFIWANGDTYKGDFDNGQPTGKGTFTWDNGDTYEGLYVRGFANPTIDHLNTPLSIKLLLGQESSGVMCGFATGVMYQYLLQTGYKKEGDSLKSAHEVSLSTQTQKNAHAKKIHDQLLQGESQLLAYGFNEHAMGLRLSSDKHYVYCSIFNSGDGLSPYHEKEKTTESGNPKYQTMRCIRVPINSMTPEKIEEFLNFQEFDNVESAYKAIFQMQGARTVVFSNEEAVWQTPQKSENCALEWIFAYLKNTMSHLDYTKLRLELFEHCRSIAETASWATQEMKTELDRKIEKRQNKLNLLRSLTIPPQKSKGTI